MYLWNRSTTLDSIHDVSFSHSHSFVKLSVETLGSELLCIVILQETCLFKRLVYSTDWNHFYGSKHFFMLTRGQEEGYTTLESLRVCCQWLLFRPEQWWHDQYAYINSINFGLHDEPLRVYFYVLKNTICQTRKPHD